MNNSNLHDDLNALAGSRTPRPIELDQVRLRARRRRRAIRSTQGGVALLATATLLVGVNVARARPRTATLVPGKGAPPAATAAGTPPASPGTNGSSPEEAQSSNAAPTAPVAASTGAAVATGERAVACGSHVDAPVDPGDHYGALTFAVASLPDNAGGPPQVTYRVTSTATSQQIREPGSPRVLILHDGAVVAGQDDAYSHGGVNDPYGKVANGITIDPAHPYTSVLPALPGQPCAGLSWPQVTNSAAGYQVALVILDRDTVYPPPPPPATGLGHVLVVQAPAGG